jgi:hypothetical protein
MADLFELAITALWGILTVATLVAGTVLVGRLALCGFTAENFLQCTLPW